MKPFLTLTLLLALALPTFGITFTVTSNADSGPGSLRDAINQAAASSATPNLIVFNIADQSRAGRTITIASTLPNLPSNLTIDGTTQPGAPFGISAARIIITDINATDHFYYFNIVAANNIQLYGLFLQSISNYWGIYIQQCNNVNIGAAGKGNILQGFAAALVATNLTEEPFTTDNITIQGNIMGTDESGTSASTAQLNGTDISTLEVTNLQIGGLNPGEGNLMNQTLEPLEYSTITNQNFGYLNIQGNKVGVDITGNTRLSPTYEALEIDGNQNTGQPTIQVNITGNVSVGGYDLTDIFNPFVIQGNHIGVGLDNVTNLISGANSGTVGDIILTYCSQGLIGGSGPGQKNYIANNNYGVFEAYCGPITISQNSFFCNTTGILFDYSHTYIHPTPYANITLLTPGTVGGTALPNSIIELFYDDECPGCEGKTYIGTTNADNNGNWSYTLPATGAIVATATDTYGATSPFSTATINTDSLVVRNATCGRANGSIKNIKVSSGTEWYWEDASGNIVSNSTDLIDVVPGTYTFVTSIGGASCSASSTPYTISNVNPPPVGPGDISITQPSCGQANGAFQDVAAFDTIAVYIWLRSGTEVSPDFTATNPLTGLAPGSYILLVGLKQDRNCFAEDGPYVLINQSGPSLDTSQVTITAATCGATNGSITNITYQNATGTVNLFWEDSTGKQISYDANLTNVPGGLYQLTINDGSGCSPLVTSWYRVPNLGSIAFDTSKMIVTPATCAEPDGAITGISATAASTLTWTTAAGQTLPINTIDITGLSAGTYLLSMTNAFGCQAETQPIVVPQIPIPAFDYTNLSTIDDTCNSGSGAILDLAMTDPSRQYTWAWFANAQPAGNTSGYLGNLKAGTYSVIVTDTYNCSVTSHPFTIQNIEYAPDPPQVSDQSIPRNTSATIVVANPQKGTYELLDNSTPGATVLATSTTGVLQTPPIPRDETFFVQFTRGDCGSVLSPVNIKVFDSVRLFVPNAFTPNSGSNNRWGVIAQGPVNKFHLAVYDRYGQIVFVTSNVNESWDGTSAGHSLTGTFAYLITGYDYYNRSFHLSGTVMVIR